MRGSQNEATVVYTTIVSLTSEAEISIRAAGLFFFSILQMSISKEASDWHLSGVLVSYSKDL